MPKSADISSYQKTLSFLDYDPETGVFLWKHGSHKAGSVAGTVVTRGHCVISLSGKVFRAHNLAWLAITGELPIDIIVHLNGDKSDNRAENLSQYNRSHGSADLAPERIVSCFDYNPGTGEFIYKERITRKPSDTAFNQKFVGEKAGHVAESGYRFVNVDGKTFRAHRVAWLIMTGSWPSDEIDHKNGRRADNRWSNLRIVDRQENCRNISIRSDNKSGHNGVSWDSSRGKWRSVIEINGKSKQLGRFDSLESAVMARDAANKEFGFYPGHGKPK
jgi:hypothetical protein